MKTSRISPRAYFLQIIFQKGEDGNSRPSPYAQSVAIENMCVALSKAAVYLFERAGKTWTGRELKMICDLRGPGSAIDPSKEAINHH